MINKVDTEWREIPGYEGLYKINKAGEVRSIERVRKTFQTPRLLPERVIAETVVKGQRSVMLNKNRNQKRLSIEELVQLTFGEDLCPIKKPL